MGIWQGNSPDLKDGLWDLAAGLRGLWTQAWGLTEVAALAGFPVQPQVLRPHRGGDAEEEETRWEKWLYTPHGYHSRPRDGVPLSCPPERVKKGTESN